jgi:hypothetical protein
MDQSVLLVQEMSQIGLAENKPEGKGATKKLVGQDLNETGGKCRFRHQKGRLRHQKGRFRHQKGRLRHQKGRFRHQKGRFRHQKKLREIARLNLLEKNGIGI